MGLSKANKTSFLKGFIPWNKGKKIPGLKHEKQFKKGNIPSNKGIPHSEEAKMKMRKKHKPLSEETRNKMSESRRGHFVSQETRIKLSEAMKRRGPKFGSESPHWKGGKNNMNNGRGDKKYAKWRSEVLARDNWVCQTCGLFKSGDMETHHIKSWAKFPELRYEVSNGVTLCRECHKLTDSYGGKNLK